MSEILDRFRTLHNEAPGRTLIHLPALHSARSAADIWNSHLLIVEQLTKWALRPHQLVVSGIGNEPEGVPLLLACRALDVALLSADPGTPPDEVMALGRRFGAASVALPNSVGAKNPAGASTAALALVPCREDERRRYPGASLLKLSSGSTGTPKTAVVTDAQLIGDGVQIIEGMNIGPSDTQIASIPLSHTYGLGVLLMPLLLQGTPIVLRESFVPHALPADARRFGARRFPGVPFMFRYLLDHEPEDGWPAHLDGLVSAGAPLPPETTQGFHQRYGVKIRTLYGTTEAGGIAFDDDPRVDSGGAVRPLPGVEISLKNEPDLPVGTGRIHVRSAAVATGYLDPSDEGFEAGGFLTGDFGTIDEEGMLSLAGRISSFINVAGRKVQPAEVETVLRAIPGIRDAEVLAVPDQSRGQQIAACIVAELPMSALDVRRQCAARLAPHKIPRVIVFLDAMPLTARGKIDHAALDARVRAAVAEGRSAV